MERKEGRKEGRSKMGLGNTNDEERNGHRTSDGAERREEGGREEWLSRQAKIGFPSTPPSFLPSLLPSFLYWIPKQARSYSD